MRSVDQVLVSMWKKNISEQEGWALRAAQRVVLESERNPDVKGIGLNQADREIVTGIVQFVKQHGFYSRKQGLVLMKIMPKYASQLLRIMREYDVNEKALGEKRLPVQEKG